MGKVIQVRDVPDDVHEALSHAAAAEDLSLTRFLNREFGRIARAAESARHNAVVVRRAKRRVGCVVDRSAILAAIDETRGE